jgi:hypothetical protein
MSISFSNPFFKLKEYSEDEKYKIFNLIAKNDFDGLESVLKDGYNLNFLFNIDKRTKILGISIDFQSPRTVFMLKNITKEMIDFLIEKGADVSFPVNTTLNTLVYFAAFGRTDIIKYLWEVKHIYMTEKLKEHAIIAASFGEKYFDYVSFKMPTSIAHPETLKYINTHIYPFEKVFGVENPLSSIKINSSNQKRNESSVTFNPLRMLSTLKGGKRSKKSKKTHKKTLKKRRSTHRKH